MAWKAEVVADRTGEWCGNGLRFATKAEAERYVFDLMMRWTLVTDTRVVEVDEEVNYRIANDRLEAVTKGDAT